MLRRCRIARCSGGPGGRTLFEPADAFFVTADALGNGFDCGAKVGDLGAQPAEGAGVRLAGAVFLDEGAKGRARS
jgi:hypothetical protein